MLCKIHHREFRKFLIKKKKEQKKVEGKENFDEIKEKNLLKHKENFD